MLIRETLFIEIQSLTLVTSSGAERRLEKARVGRDVSHLGGVCVGCDLLYLLESNSITREITTDTRIQIPLRIRSKIS